MKTPKAKNIFSVNLYKKPMFYCKASGFPVFTLIIGNFLLNISQAKTTLL